MDRPRPKYIIPLELVTSSSSSSGLDEDAMEYMRNCYRAVLEEEARATNTRTSIYRNRRASHDRFIELYFADEPHFHEGIFKERFRMSKNVFNRILNDVESNFEWFTFRIDARGRPSFTALHRCTVAIRQLATGNVPDEYDKFLEMSERTSHECLHYFFDAIIKLYKDEFLRSPTSHDLALLYEAHLERHGLPGMIGSIDCMHWKWRNFLTKYRGQYHRGDHPKPTIILEEVASQEMWFWHAFFGIAGSNNDINVLNQSTLFTNELKGIAPKAPFTVNSREYKRGYYLVDGIYPTWSTFVKVYTHPYAIKEKKMKKVQEGARKDVERAFRSLKVKWAIIDRKARTTNTDLIENIMYACMIPHNMKLKDEGTAISPVHIRDPPVQPANNEDVYIEIRDSETHFQLQFDITEHIAANLEVELTEEELSKNLPT